MKYFKNSAINIFLIGAFITSFSNAMVGQPKITYSDSKTNGFRAAVIKVNITPETPQLLSGYEPRVSAGVLDSIYHRIIALDDGKTRFVLISTEVSGFSPAFYDRVATRIHKQLGINPMNLWWSTTHTHSAPSVAPQFSGVIFPELSERAKLAAKYEKDITYTELLEEKLIEGIGEALNKLEPARIGMGWSFSLANINRRALDVEGRASLGMNPGGAVDRKIGLLRIDREDGAPLACIANYPMHGTVFGPQNTLISGDAPGAVSDYVEQKIGVPLLFINGAAGNIAPIYSYPNHVDNHPIHLSQLNQFRELLGDKILDAFKKITDSTDEVTLKTGSIIVETPRVPELEFSSILNEYIRTTDSGVKLARLPIRFLKINQETAIWSAPVELFCEISNEIRNQSPFPYTFFFGYTNGSLGYLVTENAYKHGGYEPSVSPFSPQVASDLTEAVLTYLQGELKSDKLVKE